MQQEQFLSLVSAEEATRVFEEAVQPQPLGEERISLLDSARRVLSRDVLAPHNVPFFDRSNFDGFAVCAVDTFGAEESAPVILRLNTESLTCGVVPQAAVTSGTATAISTGGMLPRGADGVVMLEHTQPIPEGIAVTRPIAPGAGIAAAGSDLGAGELVLPQGTLLGHREAGTLAALGLAEVWVWRKPRVGILSTGDELLPLGAPIAPGKVHDCNSTLLAHAVEEQGGVPHLLGVLPDEERLIEGTVREALKSVDLLLLSAGTSKGEGDLNHRVFQRFGHPGVLVHGVSLKPGKPLCLAVLEGTPAAILPGFPTSAIFTFTRFVAPVLRALAGLPPQQHRDVEAILPFPLQTDKGRTDFQMVHLVRTPEADASGGVPRFSAYPTGKGSGSISGFARADGFVEVPREVERVEAGRPVRVRLLGESASLPDLMVIGSHCVGVDRLLSRLREQGWQSRSLAVGSMGGVRAARRGECDLAGTHLMDAASGIYNEHLVTPGLRWVKGYRRRQGLVVRPQTLDLTGMKEEALRKRLTDPELRMINRNRGSGTRVLLDQLLGEARPSGFWMEASSHNAVATAVAQGRADWGITIESVAQDAGLVFYFLQDEEYDFLIPEARLEQPAVQAFLELLTAPQGQELLRTLGLEPAPDAGRLVRKAPDA